VCFSTEADMSEVIIQLVYRRTCETPSCEKGHRVNGYAVPDFIFKCSSIQGTRNAVSRPVVLGHRAAASGPRKKD
jgi:hypothetical protein